MNRLLVIFVAAFLMFGGRAIAQSDGTRSGQLLQLAAEAQNLPPDQQVAHVKCGMGWSNPLVVFQNPEGQQVAMLPPVPGLPTDGNRPTRPAAPKAPPSMARPQTPSAPVAPQAPRASVETKGAATPAPQNYPRGQVTNDQAKRLYLDGQPVGEIRALNVHLDGLCKDATGKAYINTNNLALHINIWPGSLSQFAIPVDCGQYKIARSTGEGWVFSEKTSKIPAGCKAALIGD